MRNHDQTQFVAQILHLLDLRKCAVLVEIGDFVDHLGFVVVIFLQEDARIRLVEFYFAPNQVNENRIGDLPEKGAVRSNNQLLLILCSHI